LAALQSTRQQAFLAAEADFDINVLSILQPDQIAALQSSLANQQVTRILASLIVPGGPAGSGPRNDGWRRHGWSSQPCQTSGQSQMTSSGAGTSRTVTPHCRRRSLWAQVVSVRWDVDAVGVLSAWRKMASSPTSDPA
jgi:hypothetical protein